MFGICYSDLNDSSTLKEISTERKLIEIKGLEEKNMKRNNPGNEHAKLNYVGYKPLCWRGIRANQQPS
jgi:hypothetical protein